MRSILLLLLISFSAHGRPATEEELKQLEGKWQVCASTALWDGEYQCNQWRMDGDVFKFLPSHSLFSPVFWLWKDSPIAGPCYVATPGPIHSVENAGQVNYGSVQGTLLLIQYSVANYELIPSEKNHEECAKAVAYQNQIGLKRKEEIRIIYNPFTDQAYLDAGRARFAPKILRRAR